jgi:hypothetical protein
MTGGVAGVVRAAELVGEMQEGAEQGGAVVVHSSTRPAFCLLDETAELDEVPGAPAGNRWPRSRSRESASRNG